MSACCPSAAGASCGCEPRLKPGCATIPRTRCCRRQGAEPPGKPGDDLRPCAWPASALREGEAPVAVGHHLLADLRVTGEAPHIGQEDARLAGDVRAHVPGIGERKERALGDLAHVLDP